MHNKTYAAEIAHNVSSRNRTLILERCVISLDGSWPLGDTFSLKGQGPWRQGDQPRCTAAVRGITCCRVFLLSHVYIPYARGFQTRVCSGGKQHALYTIFCSAVHDPKCDVPTPTFLMQSTLLHLFHRPARSLSLQEDMSSTRQVRLSNRPPI